MRAFRLAQVANYVGPASGGLGTVVRAVGNRHVELGGDRLLVLPSSIDRTGRTGRETTVEISSPALPGSGRGHHVLVARSAVDRALRGYRPDVLEIHDQTTLAWLTGWARRNGVPSVVFAHEQLSLIAAEVASALPRSWSENVIDWWSARLAERADVVVCASTFAAQTFLDAGAQNVRRVPFGVDLELFHPHRRPHPDVALPWRPGTLRLICVARLFHEKRLHLVLSTLGRLRATGVPAELVLVGDGPMAAELRARVAAERLPVHLIGHVGDRVALAGLMAAAHVALALGPRETFGLAALEAMASGTPVVVSDQGASHELLCDGAGLAVDDSDEAARAVVRLAADPSSAARARRRAEQFSWQATTYALRELELELMDAAPARVATGRSLLRRASSSTAA